MTLTSSVPVLRVSYYARVRVFWREVEATDPDGNVVCFGQDA